MARLKEILRLFLRERHSQRDIAAALGLGKTTIQGVIARANELALSWEHASSLREYQLVELLYPRSLPEGERTLLPDWSAVHTELKRKGMTLALLWEEYRESNPNALSYPRFCVHYRTWLSRVSVVMRQNHRAGERLFVDFAGVTVPYLNMATGEILTAQIFIAVLGASSYTFVTAVPDQTVASWVHANRAALDFFGGVPEIIVPDNLKAAVTTPSKYEPKIHPVYLELARHYNTVIIPARVRKPRDKAKAEVGVQVVERWILARLRKMTFTSIAEINRAIAPLLTGINAKVMKHIGKSRSQLFDEVDKPALRPLAPVPFEMITRKKAKVGIDYHVEVSRSYYSVPYRFVGREVEIRFTASMVEVLADGDRIALHRRLTLPGQRQTEALHMPSHHRAQAEWTPNRFLKWAKESGGPATQELASQIMARYPHPEQGFRSCRALIRLTERYGKQRVEEACQNTLSRSERSVKVVERLLSHPQTIPPPVSAISKHENIRGGEYYL